MYEWDPTAMSALIKGKINEYNMNVNIITLLIHVQRRVNTQHIANKIHNTLYSFSSAVDARLQGYVIIGAAESLVFASRA